MTKGNQLQLLVCSGNLGNAYPDEENLAEWIPDNGRCKGVLLYPARYPVRNQFSTFDEFSEIDQFDIVVIGMQEATFDIPGPPEASPKLSAAAGVKKTVANLTSYVTSHDHTKTPNGYTRKASMGGGGEGQSSDTRMLHSLLEKRLPSYTRAVSFQRGQMRLEVFVQTEQVQVEVIQTSAQNTGMAGLANKGGIVTELMVNGMTRLSFLTAHLEAHEGSSKYAMRCRSIADILGGTGEKIHDISLTSHFCFVMGDLNFRTELPGFEDMSDEEHKQKVRDMVARKDWDALNQVDELNRALSRKDCLVGFQTLHCNFPPTFKLERKQGYHYIEKRRPSYTDRILWTTGHELEKGLRPLLYEPVDRFSSSDHKPVRAAFSVSLNEGMVFRPKSQRRRSAIQLSGFLHSVTESLVSSRSHRLHIFLSEMNCFLAEPDSNSKNALPNPYICLISTPEEAVRKRSSRWHRWKKVFLFFRKTDAKEASLTTVDGWPKSSVQKQTLQPCWEGEEFNTEIKTYCADGTPLDLTGSMIRFTVMDSKQSGGDDQVLGTFSFNLGHLVRTFRAPSSPKECTGGHQPKQSRRGSIMNMFRRQDTPQETSSDPDGADPVKNIPIDAPLVRNGQETGRIRFTMEAWWMDESTARAIGDAPGASRPNSRTHSIPIFSARPSSRETSTALFSSRHNSDKKLGKESSLPNIIGKEFSLRNIASRENSGRSVTGDQRGVHELHVDKGPKERSYGHPETTVSSQNKPSCMTKSPVVARTETHGPSKWTEPSPRKRKDGVPEIAGKSETSLKPQHGPTWPTVQQKSSASIAQKEAPSTNNDHKMQRTKRVAKAPTSGTYTQKQSSVQVAWKPSGPKESPGASNSREQKNEPNGKHVASELRKHKDMPSRRSESGMAQSQMVAKAPIGQRQGPVAGRPIEASGQNLRNTGRGPSNIGNRTSENKLQSQTSVTNTLEGDTLGIPNVSRTSGRKVRSNNPDSRDGQTMAQGSRQGACETDCVRTNSNGPTVQRATRTTNNFTANEVLDTGSSEQNSKRASNANGVSGPNFTADERATIGLTMRKAPKGTMQRAPGKVPGNGTVEEGAPEMRRDLRGPNGQKGATGSKRRDTGRPDTLQGATSEATAAASLLQNELQRRQSGLGQKQNVPNMQRGGNRWQNTRNETRPPHLKKTKKEGGQSECEGGGEPLMHKGIGGPNLPKEANEPNRESPHHFL